MNKQEVKRVLELVITDNHLKQERKDTNKSFKEWSNDERLYILNNIESFIKDIDKMEDKIFDLFFNK